MEESLRYQVTHAVNHDVNVSPILAWMDKQFNTQDIKENLLLLPLRIATQKGEVRNLRDSFQEADLPRKMMELEMIDDIAMEKNPSTGKAIYSNDKMRDAELKRRKAEDEGYQEFQRYAKEAERELSAAEDELVRLEQRFMAYGKVSEFVAAEMNLVAGVSRVPGGVKVRPEVPEGTGTWKQPTGQPY
jgi:hypothetical protein